MGLNHSLNPKPQTNLLINNVKIELEVTKLHGVTLDCKLSWSKHVDTTVAKMGRSMSIIKHCSTFLRALSTALSTRQVLQTLVLSILDYCSVVWSDSTVGPWIYRESKH